MTEVRRIPIPTIAIGVLVLACAGWLVARAVNQGSASAGDSQVPKKYVAKVIASYPHDRRAFTQGLLWYEGKLYESTGQRGHSTVRRVAPTTGKVEKSVALPRRLFGEGLARIDKKLYQLTWTAGECWVYDLETFEGSKKFDYENEGWGLCHDGTHLVMSNGTSQLVFRNPKTFEIKKRITATWHGQAVGDLNELEYVDGSIYANIWKKDYIAIIDPENGVITASIQVPASLGPPRGRDSDYVLNGIAHDPATGDLYITGKNWPKMYRVKLVEQK